MMTTDSLLIRLFSGGGADIPLQSPTHRYRTLSMNEAGTVARLCRPYSMLILGIFCYIEARTRSG